MRIYGKIEVCVMKKLDKVDKKIIQILQKNDPHTAQGDCRTGIFVITIGVCKN